MEPFTAAQEDSPGSSKEEGEMSDASAASSLSRPPSPQSPLLKRKAPVSNTRQASPKRQRSRHAPSPIRHPQPIRRSPRRSAVLQHRSRTPPRWQPTRSPSPATMLRLREAAAKHVYEPAPLPVRRRRSPSPIMRRQVVRPVSPVRRVVMDEGEVEELFRTALKNAALEKRPPFNISLINDRMRLLNRRYDVRHTSFGSFAAMATHFERKGLLATRRDRHSVVIILPQRLFPTSSLEEATRPCTFTITFTCPIKVTITVAITCARTQQISLRVLPLSRQAQSVPHLNVAILFTRAQKTALTFQLILIAAAATAALILLIRR
eukprot:jgi/Chlat1/5384/Chrsp35S08987